jgi:hypothetical protein
MTPVVQRFHNLLPPPPQGHSSQQVVVIPAPKSQISRPCFRQVSHFPLRGHRGEPGDEIGVKVKRAVF